MEQLLKERTPVYELVADLILDVDELAAEEVAKAVTEGVQA